MDKTYNPDAIEKKWYPTWEEKHYFAPAETGSAYCIVIPPPNVTGNLHMGHGLDYTLMDILTRYHRMLGRKTLWLPGSDHAGIATQMVIERQLLLEGKTRVEYGREAFVERIWQWKKESGGNINRQLRRLGASVDWQRERFTLDEGLSRAVREAFVRLYEEGLIYRGTRLANWDPKLLTAISDLEVVNTEEEGQLWHIRYSLANGKGHVTVATTRPETLLGDVAVAVHPDDERYQKLIGQSVQLPLTGRTIPIIADDFVEQSFGSGCVKITPAHDFTDYAVGQRHQLTPINVFTPDARLNKNVPHAYQGLDRFEARKQIVKDLECLGLIEKVEKHLLKIPRGDRSDAIIEPYLTEQWFMKMKPSAAEAIQAVEKDHVQFIPDNWRKLYFQWMHNIEDWCISRQLWWGHRIPAWYDKEGNVYVGHDENSIRERFHLTADTVLEQDNDVLDTWFSSSLWPFSTLGWPDETADLKTFYPTAVLVTGFDIIFFWVARMIMMGLKLTGDVPFKEVFIHGLICDANGKKMSKSRGNGLDPLDLIDGIALDDLIQKRTQGLMQPAMAQKIEEDTRKQFPDGISAHGTDALRFTLCAIATYAREIRFDLNRLAGSRNFCNKLWNAARYVLMNTENHAIDSQQRKLSLADQWILSRLQDVIQSAHQHLAQYRFDMLAQVLYDFTWNAFCDWYLELSKPILTATTSTPEELHGTRHTLITVLETLLRLLHPIMPFITEEIWQRVATIAQKQGESIMLQAYPEADITLQNAEVEAELEWVKNIIIAVRTLRSEMNIPPNKLLPLILKKGDAQDKTRYHTHEHLITTLAKLQSVTWHTENQSPPESAMTLVGQLELLIPMAGFIDKKEESARLEKEIKKCEQELFRINNKLNNADFVERAPADVIGKERKKKEELTLFLQKLLQQKEIQGYISHGE